MQATASQKNSIIINIKSKRVITGSIVKPKNIRKCAKKQMSMRPISLPTSTKFMRTGICCSFIVGTRTNITMMGHLQHNRHQVNAVGIVNEIWHRQLDSKATAVHGERLSFPAYSSNQEYQLNRRQQQLQQPQFGDSTSFHGGLARVSNSFTNLSSQPQQQQYRPQFSAIPCPVSGVFGAAAWQSTTTMENASPSPPSLVQWQNYSMFMDAAEPWPSGTGNRSATTGEQLNTPRPENVCGFENGSFGGLGVSEAKVNLTNVFSKSSGIIENSEEDCNNNPHNNSSRHGEKEQPFDLKCSNYGSISSPMTPPSSSRAESVVTAGFNSWEFESCLEEVLLSPASYITTPHHSTGVASPGSSSGDTERKPDELETFVDFNTIMFSPSTIVDPSEEDDFNIPLHEEIEQLSNSFYCKSNNLVSVNTDSASEADIVSPSFLKLLQEESTLSAAPTTTTTTAASNDISDGQTPSNASGAVFGTQPSIANSFFSDADDDDDDEQLDEKQKNKKPEDQRYDLAVAAARPQAALQNVSSKDETLDVKTQTQLEHNYTIKLPFDGDSHILSKNNTVKEENLAKLSKARESLQNQQPAIQKRSAIPAVQYRQSVKRQLFQRMRSRMAEDNRNRKVPSLKLKILNPLEAAISAPDDGETTLLTNTQMLLNTPDITNDLLDLEAETLKKEDEFDLLTYITSGTDYDEVPTSPVEEKPTVPPTKEQAATAPAKSTQSTICAPTLSDLFNPAKRKLPTITIENIDELTASSNFKRFRSAASSTTSSVCGDNASETSSTRPQKRRGRPPKAVSSIRDRSEYDHLNEADMRYREQRDKNNEASRKSRINRKDRELKLESEARELNRNYEVLVTEGEHLIKECSRWRKAVMRLALL